MHNDKPGNLREALDSLPQDLEPSRDLWPQIRASIAAETRAMRGGPLAGRGRQLAAACALILTTSVATYFVTRETLQPSANSSADAGMRIRAAYDGAALGADYLRARADLDRLFAERIAALPADTRAKLENNLADLRRAADQIVATLAEHPSDPLLQELLYSTRQRELQLLADVGGLPLIKS